MIFFNFPICVTYGKIRQPEDEHKIIFFNISYNYQIKITITYYLYHPIERRASMNKDSVIKARCSSEIKQQVQNYTQSHNINESEFLLSSVQTVLQCNVPNNYNEKLQFIYQYQYNLLRNKLFNLINLNSTIPSYTKDQIRKELSNNDFSQFNLH